MKRLSWTILVAVVAAGCVTASPGARNDRSFDIEIGTGPEELEVRAQLDGYPIPGATVEACRGDEPAIVAYTDVQGRARMRLPYGDWDVSVNLVGLRGASGLVTVGYGVPILATATMSLETERRESAGFCQSNCTLPGLELAPGEYLFLNTGCAWPIPW